MDWHESQSFIFVISQHYEIHKHTYNQLMHKQLLHTLSIKTPELIWFASFPNSDNT